MVCDGSAGASINININVFFATTDKKKNSCVRRILHMSLRTAVWPSAKAGHHYAGHCQVGMKTDRIRTDIIDIVFVFIFMFGFGFE
jgi:hypothetical protein